MSPIRPGSGSNVANDSFETTGVPNESFATLNWGQGGPRAVATTETGRLNLDFAGTLTSDAVKGAFTTFERRRPAT